MKPRTIQDWVEQTNPEAYKNGKWGCLMLHDADEKETAKKEYPSGQLVELETGRDYWFWTTE